MFSFIVPAFNEEGNIAATVETITSAALESGLSEIQIVVVNDGSTDGTAQVLQRVMTQYPHLHVVTHPVNQGFGAAFRSGMAAVRGDRCMIVPGDNDLERNFLLLMLRFRDSAELVMSFLVNTENRTLLRNVLSYLYRIAYLVAFRIHANYINGPCIYPTALLKRLTIRGSGFSVAAEVVTKLLRSGTTFCEIPGYTQTGTRPRGMLSLRNFWAVTRSFLQLCIDIHIVHRRTFDKVPRRIFVDFTAPPAMGGSHGRHGFARG